MHRKQSRVRAVAVMEAERPVVKEEAGMAAASVEAEEMEVATEEAKVVELLCFESCCCY